MAEVAGIMAAKQTQNIIPMCHQIPLDYVKISFDLGYSKEMQNFLSRLSQYEKNKAIARSIEDGNEPILKEQDERKIIRIECECQVSEQKTGCEMEALTGVSVAALTIYDMCKSSDKHI